MIYLTSETRVMIASKAVDFRKSIDGLSGLCEYELGQNARSGTLFVFINKNKTMIRILVYDINGFWIMTKRLSVGKFVWKFGEEKVSEIHSIVLRKLLTGIINEKRSN